MFHRLDTLLRLRSISVPGASRRQGTVGSQVMPNLLKGGLNGKLSAVSPGYDEVLELACYPSFDALPETVDKVILPWSTGIWIRPWPGT